LRKILALLVLLIASQSSYSAELFGTVDAISGNAYAIDPSGKSTFISEGLKIYEGQTINSEQDGEVHLVTEDGGIIAIRPNTFFRVDGYKAEGNASDKIFMSLLKGTVRSITGWVGKYNNSAYRLSTPTATIGIRGTDHETTVIEKGEGDEAGTYDNVNEGSTVLKTPQGAAEVTPGKFAFAAKGRAVAPIFLTQRPRFLANRRLRIEDRIQQRKEFMHTRLDHMREDRIKNPRAFQGSRLKQQTERIGNTRGPERARAMEKRQEFREHRLEQARPKQMGRQIDGKLNREIGQGRLKSGNEQRREIVKGNNKPERKVLRPPEKKHKRD